MITSEVLTKGVELGVITAEQAERLRELKTAGAPPELPVSPDDEQLRLISSFSDIFVAIGLAMFLAAIGYFGSRSGGLLGMWITIAITAWLLAEFFTRIRRMALPSIVLQIVFSSAVFFTAIAYLGADARANIRAQTVLSGYGLNGFGPIKTALASSLTALATALHYWRFQVPASVAAGCCAVTSAVVGLFYAMSPALSPFAHNALILVCGLAIFSLAMRFDISDPARLTRRTDIAFWLHLLAAPMIVHSLIKWMTTDAAVLVPAKSVLPPMTAVAIIAVFLALGFVAVLIDRRALLVSGLTSAGYAFWTLISQAGLSDMTTPLTLLVVGAFVLLLSAGWRPLRAGILMTIPSALTRRLPQPTLSA